jgi:hypothetical protein
MAQLLAWVVQAVLLVAGWQVWQGFAGLATPVE